MLSTYNDISIFKKDIKIGCIQSISVSQIKENKYLGLPIPVPNKWKRVIEADCCRFMISINDLNDFDRLSLTEDNGIDFRFGVEILSGKVKYNKDGYITFRSESKSLCKEEGFRFREPAYDFYLCDALYVLEFVRIIRDFSEPVDIV